MSKADTVTIAAIEAGVPTLVAARILTDRFHTMVRKRIEADLVCNFRTEPPHDGRSHRGQSKKRPLTAEELEKKGLTKV